MTITLSASEKVYWEGFVAGHAQWQTGMSLNPASAPKYEDHTPGMPFYAGEWERGYRAAVGQIVANTPLYPAVVYVLRDSDQFLGIQVVYDGDTKYVSPSGEVSSAHPAGVASSNDITPFDPQRVEEVERLAKAFAYHGFNDLHGQAFLPWHQAVNNVLTLPVAAGGMEVNDVDLIRGMASAGWSFNPYHKGFVHVL